jgi:hypothetical protein
VAARRLVIVMIVLLAISTLAAALLPPPDRDRATTEPRRPPPAPIASASGPSPGLLLDAGMRVGAAERTVRIERGDRLRLAVSVGSGDDVEIPGFGLTEAATPFAPARFDLVGRRRGIFPVRAVGSDQSAGRVLVGRRGSGRCGVTRSEARRARGSARPCSR